MGSKQRIPGVNPDRPFPPPPPIMPLKGDTYIKISHTENGFVVIVPSMTDADMVVCFEQRESDKCAVKALVSSLQRVVEALGCLGSKHDTCKIKILCQDEEN